MLIDQIQSDLKQSMLSKDELKTSTLRMLISEIRYAALTNRDKSTEPEGQALGSNLPDEVVITVVQKEAKKRKESIEGFRQAGREEQAQKEESELAILQSYLPQQISDQELKKLVEDTIKETSASSMQDMGRVIGAVKQKTGQSAEGSRISQVVKECLTTI